MQFKALALFTLVPALTFATPVPGGSERPGTGHPPTSFNNQGSGNACGSGRVAYCCNDGLFNCPLLSDACDNGDVYCCNNNNQQRDGWLNVNDGNCVQDYSFSKEQVTDVLDSFTDGIVGGPGINGVTDTSGVVGDLLRSPGTKGLSGVTSGVAGGPLGGGSGIGSLGSGLGLLQN